MSKISSIDKVMTLVGGIKRHYGSKSKHLTHYEVLGLKENATKKEIRLAFLKLSKQVHPDTSNKDNHDDFVKLNEAYKVLSKDSLRHNYDFDLKYQKTNIRYGHRNVTWQEWKGQTGSTGPLYSNNNSSSHFEENYYGIKGVKKVRNITIVFICLVASAFSFGFHLMTLVISPSFNRKKLMEKSEQYSKDYQELREKAVKLTNKEKLAALMKEHGADVTNKNSK